MCSDFKKIKKFQIFELKENDAFSFINGHLSYRNKFQVC